MRLFLASQNLEGYSDVLVGMAGINKRMAYIGNAKDDWFPNDRSAKTAEHQIEFEALGFEFIEIDLRNYFQRPDALENDLHNIGLLWLSGGNTFLLNRAVRDSGLDKTISKYLKEDRFVLGGSSAGSILATPSLKGSELGDEPEKVKTIYSKEIIWDGLGLVDFYIVPHYKSDWFGNEAELMVDYYKKQNWPYYALKDGQVIIVNGDKTEFLK